MKVFFHLIIGLFFALLSATLIVQNNIELFMGKKDDLNSVTVYFKSTTLEKEAEEFAQNNFKTATSFKKISKSEALKDFKETFGEFSSNLSDLDTITDLIPLSYEALFSNKALKNSFVESISGNDLIDEIVSMDAVFTRYNSLQKSIGAFIFTLFAAGFFLSALLTSLLIKNIVYQDHKKIEIYSLFGKSYSSITADYFKQMLKYFVATAAFSLAFGYVLFTFFKIRFAAIPDLRFIGDRLIFLTPVQVISLILGFALSYFSGLYLVLRQAVRKSFSR